MIHHITYADERMTISLDACRRSALANGCDGSLYCGPDAAWQTTDTFQWLNKGVLNQDRGAGYWIWKPWCIAKAMFEYCKDGDILIYSDAGVEFVAPVQEIINRMDEDIFFFTNGFPHVEWCKMDCIKSINHDRQDVFEGLEAGDDYVQRKQVQASVIFFKVNQKTRDFVKEWLLYCQFPGFIDDTPSKIPNFPTFAEHRHDQAILTCLQIKYGYTLHWWPTQYSNHLPRDQRDSYPVMFNHHRKRNNEY